MQRVVEQERVLSQLFHSPSKAGKSTLTSTAPTPHLVLDAEGSWNYINQRGFNTGVPLRKKLWNPLTEALPRFDDTWDVARVHVDSWQVLQQTYVHLTNYEHDFVSLTLDSVTEAQRRCFTPDTELLTPTGWVRIDEVQQDDVIAQYLSDTGTISFTSVLDVQKLAHHGDLVQVQTTFSDLAVTPDHRMLVKTRANFIHERPAESLRVGLRLPVAGVGDGADDPGISDDEIRLLAAVQADSYQATTNVFAFNLKKRRKQERLAQLCDSTKTHYRRLRGRVPGWEHFRVFRTASIDKWVSEKTFRWEMLTWPEHQRRVFLEELGHWDGDFCPRGIYYSTTNDTNAEIVSALGVLTGYGVHTTTSCTRIGTSYHRIHLSNYLWRSVSAPHLIQRSYYEGYVYCVTVSSGFVVTRRSGKTTIAGNCKQNIKGGGQMQIQQWGQLLDQMDGLIRGFRDLLFLPNTLRVVTFNAETAMKEGKWRPFMQGQIRDTMPYWVDICGYLFTEMRPDGDSQVKFKRMLIGEGVDPAYVVGERVQGRLPDIIDNPNISDMLARVHPNREESK